MVERCIRRKYAHGIRPRSCRTSRRLGDTTELKREALELRQRRSRGSHAVAWTLFLLAAGLAGIIVIAPSLPNSFPLVFAIAGFRQLALLSAVATTLLIAGLLFLLVHRRMSAATLMITAALVIGFLIALPSEPAYDRVPLPRAESIRILSWNTNQQALNSELEALAERTQPDVIVLPEYFTQIARSSLEPLAEKEGMSIYGWNASSATVLISNRLGRYVLDNSNTPPWAGINLVPVKSSSPHLVIAHLQRPDVASTRTWAEHARWVEGECGQPNTVAVGDFNSTLANLGDSGIGNCVDVAASLGIKATGTWPAALPAWLGASIDHTFATAEWKSISFRVLTGPDTGGSDHRPIFAVIQRR